MTKRDDPARYERERRAKDLDRSRELGRASYAKHRDKRRAEANAKRAADPEAARAYQREQYAKHRERRVADARERRAGNRERLAAEAKARYYAKHEEKKARRRELEKRPESREKFYGYIFEWVKRNPDKVARYNARRRLVEQTGAAPHEISDDLADAKAEELRIMRWVREQLSAKADRNPKGGDAKQAPSHSDESGGARQGICPNDTGV